MTTIVSRADLRKAADAIAKAAAAELTRLGYRLEVRGGRYGSDAYARIGIVPLTAAGNPALQRASLTQPPHTAHDETEEVVQPAPVQTVADTYAAERLGRPDLTIGRVFRVRGTEYRITGFKLNRPAYPVSAERVRDGKRFKFGAVQIPRA